MRFTLLSFLVAFGLMPRCHAQDTFLRGVVLQADSVSAAPGILIRVAGTGQTAVSNGKGEFELVLKSAGSHLALECSGLGYETLVVNQVAGNGSPLRLILREKSATLNEFILIGEASMPHNPGSATLLDAKVLAEFKQTDVNRILSRVPGINLQEEDGFGLRPNIGMRGTGVSRSAKITLMEDGVLLAPAPYSEPAAYYFPQVARMNGIEVLKGSSQIKYGPFTTGGAINFLSAPLPDTLQALLFAGAGSFGSLQTHIRAGNRHKHVSYLVERFWNRADGFKNLDGGGNTGFIKDDVLAKIGLHSAPGAKVKQEAEIKLGRSTEDSHETYLGLSEADFTANPFRRYAASGNDRMQSEQQQLKLAYSIKPIRRLTLSAAVYRNTFSRNWYRLDHLADSAGNRVSIVALLGNPDAYPIHYGLLGPGSGAAGRMGVRANNRSYVSEGVQGEAMYEFRTGRISHLVDAGIRAHRDEADRFQHVDYYEWLGSSTSLAVAGNPGSESNRILYSRAFSSFMQYRMVLGKVSLQGGVRQESIRQGIRDFGKLDPERTGDFLTESANAVQVWLPGLGFEWSWREYLSFFGGLHKGFSPPGGKADTRAEESYNSELGFRCSNGKGNLEGVIYHTQYQNLLGAETAAAGGSGTGDLFNAGRVLSYGAELSGTYGWTIGEWSLPVRFSYSYSKAFFLSSFQSLNEDWGGVKSGDEFPYLAPHQAYVQAGLEYMGMRAYLGTRYMGAMRSQAGTGAVAEGQGTDAYVIGDLALQYQVNSRLQVRAGVNNLGNTTYLVARRPAGLRPGMPRFFTMGLAFEL